MELAQAMAEQELAKKIQKALQECGADRTALLHFCEAQIKSMWITALDILEEVLPHTKGDGSNNEKLFRAYMHRILDKGNHLQRELPKELGCYIIQQVIERTVVERVTVRGEGPWNLPANVRIPQRYMPDPPKN